MRLSCAHYNKNLDFQISTERQGRLLHQHNRNGRQAHPENTHNAYIAHYWQYTPHHQHQMTDPRQFTHNNRPYTDQNYRHITSQFIDAQNKLTDTLYKPQLQNYKNTYVSDLRTCTVKNKEEFYSWLLSIEKVAKLMDSDPNEICFAKAEGNLLKFLYSVNFK